MGSPALPLLVVYLTLFATTCWSSEVQPAVCQEQLVDFASSRTKFLDDRHRALAKAVTESNAASGKPAIRQQIRNRINAEIQQAKNDPVRQSILQVELLRLSESGITEPDVARMRAGVRKSLGGALWTPEAAEAAVLFASSIEKFETDDERFDMLFNAITAHRGFFGDVDRQASIWVALVDLGANKDKVIKAARNFAVASNGMRNPRARFEAQLRVLQFISTDDDLYAPAAKAVVPVALAIVRTKLPNKSADESSCYANFSGYSPQMTAAMSLAASDVEKREFIRLAVLHFASGVTFETHAQFIMQDISLLIAARLADYDAFLAAMAIAGDGYSGCDSSTRSNVICGLSQSANVFSQMSEHTLSLALLEDAKKVAEARQLKPEVLWSVRLAYTAAEWKHGQKSIAASTITSIDPSAIERDASAADIAIFHKLRAEIADALLDPVTATSSLSALVDRAIMENRKPASTAEGGDPSRDTITAAATALVKQSIDRSFCLDCGVPVPEPALRWLNEGIGKRKLSSGAAGDKYLLRLSLPKQVAGTPDLRIFDQAFSSSFGKNWPVVFGRAKGRLPKGAADSSVTRAIAIAASLLEASGINFAASAGSFDYQKSLDIIVTFIGANQEKKRKIWDDEFWKDVFPIYAEEGQTDDFQEIISDFAKHLGSAGFSDSAEFVLLELVGLQVISPEGTLEADAASLELAKKRAAFWMSVHTRLASLLVVKKDWSDANDFLNIARRIATGRLDDEWTSSPDRVGLLLRELRPALKLAAQTRISIIGASDANERRPALAFEELQLAMLGDTAAGLQAAQRRRLIAEPNLSEALTTRDRANAQISFLNAFDSAVGVFDESSRSEQRRKLTVARDAASKQANDLLPVTESLASLRPLAAKEAQRHLSSNEALIILHAGDDGIYGSFISKVGKPIFWRRQISISDLELRVVALREGLVVKGRLPNFDVSQAQELFQILLGPVSAELKTVQNLLVVADGPLLSFPLAVLPADRPAAIPRNAGEFRQANIQWLGLSHAIAYLPTARALEARAAQPLASRAKYSFAGIGNPVLGSPTNALRSFDYAAVFRKDSLADVDKLRLQASLPETETEIRAISKLVRGREQDLFLADNASELAVRTNGLGDYRIIMFATHGLMGGQLAGVSEPGLVLTPPQQASAANDGLLTASEIMGLKLDANLVILSACNTAASDGRPRAEGFSGLTRAFLSAGARNVIVTHWAIPSVPAVAVTTMIMNEKEGDPTRSWSEAMRRAFKLMVQTEGPPEFAHPSNWAAFSLVGVQSQ